MFFLKDFEQKNAIYANAEMSVNCIVANQKFQY